MSTWRHNSSVNPLSQTITTSVLQAPGSHWDLSLCQEASRKLAPRRDPNLELLGYSCQNLRVHRSSCPHPASPSQLIIKQSTGPGRARLCLLAIQARGIGSSPRCQPQSYPHCTWQLLLRPLHGSNGLSKAYNAYDPVTLLQCGRQLQCERYNAKPRDSRLQLKRCHPHTLGTFKAFPRSLRLCKAKHPSTPGALYSIAHIEA